ncbi:hypothetical protein J4423_05190 [Candidatus Pacearchaeota archaeon]|nr:hypothetical protein [Candidatus Pacearchaeota archaeon]
MNLGEIIAQEVIKGFLDFKPKEVHFFGEDKDLVCEVIKTLKKYDKDLICRVEDFRNDFARRLGSINKPYRVDVDELARYYFKESS